MPGDLEKMDPEKIKSVDDLTAAISAEIAKKKVGAAEVKRVQDQGVSEGENFLKEFPSTKEYVIANDRRVSKKVIDFDPETSLVKLEEGRVLRGKQIRQTILIDVEDFRKLYVEKEEEKDLIEMFEDHQEVWKLLEPNLESLYKEVVQGVRDYEKQTLDTKGVALTNNDFFGTKKREFGIAVRVILTEMTEMTPQEQNKISDKAFDEMVTLEKSKK